MANCLLKDPRFEVWSAGFWLSLRSLVARNLELSNWLIFDKLNGRQFRLCIKEQNFLGMLSDHFHTSQFRIKWRSLHKVRRREVSQRVLADGVEAIIAARDGKLGKIDVLKSMNDCEFNEYATKILNS
jgi:hypothetical protein